MKITIVGAGYVGLVSGGCFADLGHEVTVVESDPAKLQLLTRGRVPIYEPGLDALVAHNVEASRLRFSGDLAGEIVQSDAVFIAVGTPTYGPDGETDLSCVYRVSEEIAGAIRRYTVVVMKSTAPIGTSDEIERIIGITNPRARFAVVSNPEFMREGSAIEDFIRPHRIVVGVEDDRAKNVMAEIYEPLNASAVPIHFTSRRSAELTKYAANAFLAMKVSFINEIADLCETLGADVRDVAHGMGMDPRIGRQFLDAGPGYGGSCLPKDTRALAHAGRLAGCCMRLVEATIAVNERRKLSMARKVVEACGDVNGTRIAVLGLTFKPDTDDMREAPSVTIIRTLQKAGATISAYDPAGMTNARDELPGVKFAASLYDAAEKSDALVIITEWDEFRLLDFERLKEIMNRPAIVDLRNMFQRDAIEREGFRYIGVGQENTAAQAHSVEDAVAAAIA
jgi:UDPglucose 6-dehydrogenase